jgi:hypothetical protein
MRTRFRRLARLERLTAPYLRRQEADEEAWRKWQLAAARAHAIRLGALVLRGEPKLDEALEAAWVRCLTKFDVPSVVELGRPAGHEDFGDALRLAEPVLQELPGETEQEKFQHLFDVAPSWLLWFTRAIITALVLGLKYTDRPRPRAGTVGFREGDKWPKLPKGTLQAGDPMPSSTLTGEEQRELVALAEKPEDERNRHERRRLRELISSELGEARPRS